MCSPSDHYFWRTITEGGVGSSWCNFYEGAWLLLVLILIALAELIVLALSGFEKPMPVQIRNLFLMRHQRRITLVFSLFCAFFSLLVGLIILLNPEWVIGILGETETITLYSISPTALTYVLSLFERMKWAVILSIATIMLVNIDLTKIVWENNVLALIKKMSQNSWVYFRAWGSMENLKKIVDHVIVIVDHVIVIVDHVIVRAQVQASILCTPRPLAGTPKIRLFSNASQGPEEWDMWQARKIKGWKIILDLSGLNVWIDQDPPQNENQELVDLCHLRHVTLNGNHYYEITASEDPLNGEIIPKRHDSDNWLKLNKKHVLRFQHVIFDIEIVNKK